MHSNIESNEKLIILFLHTVNTVNEKWACLCHYFSHTPLIPVPRSLISKVIPSYTQLYPPHPTPTPSLFQYPLLLHTWDYFRDLELVPHHWPLTHFMPWILSRRQTFGLLKFSWVREKASGIKLVKRNQELTIVRSSDRRCSVKKVFWKILQIL